MNTVIQKDEIKPNEKQQLAIDTINGQVMMLAGPGTGKTFTLIERVKNMLENGIDPSSILCLTFSDAAATEMRQRLIKNIGVKASAVEVYTYHSFCNDVIRTNPSQFDMAGNVKLISDTEKIKLIKECIDELNLKVFVPKRSDRYYYAADFVKYAEKIKSKRFHSKEEYEAYKYSNEELQPRIEELKSEIYEREQRGETRNKGRYDEIAKIEEKIAKALELWDIYELYSTKMLENNLIDFSDMINYVLDAFDEDKAFLKEVSKKYKYFLVDEYQDTNEAQNAIIFNLLEGNPEKNIFVVGDDDQIIYSFQGAKTDTLENFLDLYPDTEVICLTENNRSTKSILDFSYALIDTDKTRLEHNPKYAQKGIIKKLDAVNPKVTPLDTKVRRLHFGQAMQEMNFIVDEIDKLVKSDKCPKDDDGNKCYSKISVICKKRSELHTYAELLKSNNIPFQIDEGKNIFTIRSSILLYFYMKALNNYLMSSDKLFGILLSEPFKINLKDYNKILHEKHLYRKDESSDFITLMNKLGDWEEPEKIKNFLSTFYDLQRFAQEHSLRSTVIEILNRTGMLEYFHSLDDCRMENLMGIKAVIEEAGNFESSDSTVNLGDFINYLDDCWVNNIDISTDKDNGVQNAIQLTTYHGSKGREFDYVYLPNLVANKWEDFKNPREYKFIFDIPISEQQKDSELLRLLFVGITRAKYALTISFADRCDGKETYVTKYLEGFADYDFDSQNYECSDEEAMNEFVRFISKDVYDNRTAFISQIKERISKLELSPSRLNDYIGCPRKFFYTKILGIDVEESDWDSANYGSVIHDILYKSVVRAKDEGKYPEISEIYAQFDKAMEDSKFTSEAQQERFERLGKQVIESYYPHFSNFPVSAIEAVESEFGGLEIAGHTITGKIDRIEVNKDGTYRLCDYKTSKPVSSAQISKDGSKSDYYNQLCFYKYAYEKIKGKSVADAGIIYVEDHTKNVFKPLGDEDMEYIENKIKEVLSNIDQMKFDPVKENPEGACKFCAYKQLCRLDLI